MRARSFWAFCAVFCAACGKSPEVLGDVFTPSASVIGVPLIAAAGRASADAEPPPPELVCPPDMVRVKKSFCVDRYEAEIVDTDTERPLSIHYPPIVPSFERYLEERKAEATRFRNLELEAEHPELADFPSLPDWQRRGRVKPKAVSRPNALPNAYLSLPMATRACEQAGKRLCSLDEWQTACRGEQGRPFPYGEKYKQGVCNVFREDHPGNVLFRNMSVCMLDPRMNKVTVKGKPLLRKTGATPACKSEWDGDAIYDMVGNLDEWVDDPEGTFAGGFFSRTAKNGCDKVIRAHAPSYFDYSTGVRCCSDLRPKGEGAKAQDPKKQKEQKEPDGSDRPAPSAPSSANTAKAPTP